MDTREVIRFDPFVDKDRLNFLISNREHEQLLVSHLKCVLNWNTYIYQFDKALIGTSTEVLNKTPYSEPIEEINSKISLLLHIFPELEESKSISFLTDLNTKLNHDDVFGIDELFLESLCAPNLYNLQCFMVINGNKYRGWNGPTHRFVECWESEVLL